MSTLAQFRTAVAGRIGLDNSTAGDQGDIDLWVNQGVTDVVMRTACQVLPGTMALTPGVADYTLDAAILKIYDMYILAGGLTYSLELISADDLLAMRRSTTAAVSPAQYYSVLGSDLLMIYPTPSAADTLYTYYIPRPATISAASATPTEIPSEFHKAVEYYALAQAADQTDDTSSQGGQSYLQQYELWIHRIKRWVAFKGNHRRPRAAVGGSKGTLPFHDRSRYPGGYA